MIRVPLLAIGAAALLAAPLGAQNAATRQGSSAQEILHAETFIKPPADVEKMIMTPRTDISFTNPSPDRKWFVRTPGKDRGDIDAYGKAHINLGGLQIDTKANRARSVTTATDAGITLVDPRSMATKTIDTPKGATISSPTWSPSGAQAAYLANFDAASHVFVADVSTGKSVQITRTPVLATLVTSLEWTPDGKGIVTVLIPDARGAIPVHGKANGVEDGPEVRLTESRALPQVVHASLLEDPHDKALLEYYTTGQVAVIDVRSKAVRKVGTPAMIREVDISPDGRYFRITRMVEPFSYIVPVSNFGSVEELWDANGKVLATLDRTPLREAGRGRGNSGSAADTGKRDIAWNPVGPGLVYLQSEFAPAPANGRRGASSGGGAARGQGQRARPSHVRFMNWLPPFGPNDVKVVYEGTGRLTNVMYSADGKTMFVADSGGVFAVRTSDPSKKYALGANVTIPNPNRGRGFGGGRGNGASTNSENGGALATRLDVHGDPVVVVGSDDRTVFLSGARMPGANWHTRAPRPWVDRLDFESGKRSRVFDAPADAYEEFVTALDDDYNQYIYTHESPTIIADAWLRDTKAASSKQLTHAVDVGPQVTGAQYKRIQVTRPRDGVKFWVDITLPKDWRPGRRLPGIIWFYPREYTSQADYDSSKYSVNINKFPAVPSARPASSVKIWASQGYALIEPDCPIMGDSGRMNDNYTRDIRENLDAVVDAVVDAGYVDRDRMGIGGHSYGAFSTVNALTLVPYFKAGIAGDGMYNRSLTPFGFQSERRNLFEDPQLYIDVSPFFRAGQISGALLMYHAMEDQNVGTALISSVRMFQALQGLGKPAALYMYHYEDHSDATYATDLDLWARWLAWFDMYVKHPAPEATSSATP